MCLGLKEAVEAYLRSDLRRSDDHDFESVIEALEKSRRIFDKQEFIEEFQLHFMTRLNELSKILLQDCWNGQSAKPDSVRETQTAKLGISKFAILHHILVWSFAVLY